MTSRLDKLEARLAKANNHLRDACKRGRLRLSIPVQQDRDDDTVIQAALNDEAALIAVARAAHAWWNRPEDIRPLQDLRLYEAVDDALARLEGGGEACQAQEAVDDAAGAKS